MHTSVHFINVWKVKGVLLDSLKTKWNWKVRKKDDFTPRNSTEKT